MLHTPGETHTAERCSLAFVVDKNIAVKAIPEEDYVFLVFEVDVGSRKHMRVQAAQKQDPHSQAHWAARLTAAAVVGSRSGGGGRRPYLESLAKNSK